MEKITNQLKHISNQKLLEELTGRVQQGIISLTEATELALKQQKNSTILKELVRRIKLKEIRFNYSNIYPPQKISGLISWDATDKYYLEFEELEEYLEKEKQEWERNQEQKWKEVNKKDHGKN